MLTERLQRSMLPFTITNLLNRASEVHFRDLNTYPHKYLDAISIVEVRKTEGHIHIGE